ncbi:protoporphyrinogen oxidase [Nocardioides sp. Kera G14]|uniref:protoporphyrinogen oxidase n=1 Tax=Nocardioides sp. Kera G14 TaxID=2884264 RepID=UPI002AB0B640|nr:protoporphyrinogen oxidase [Nocardioides sp. Kera G14]
MRVVVIGAGVAGLVAAHDLAAADHDVTVLEASSYVGGKLRLASVADVMVDVGAEAMLARRPEGIALCAELRVPIVHPTAATSRIWTDGALRPMPPSLMGAPMDVDALEASGILSDAGMERVRAEAALPTDVEPRESEATVGDLIDARFGPEVTDKLVEPLLGGVYAGRARRISVREAVPQLATLLERGPLTPQLAAIPRGSDAPVFAGIKGGMGLMPQRLAEGLDVRTDTVVELVTRTGDGWRVETADERLDADAVVLAVQASFAARMLDRLAAGSAVTERLAQVEYADVAVITHAFRADDLDDEPLDGSVSGFLVPPSEGRFIKASTFSFAKWDWVREAGEMAGVRHLRTSVGRAGDASWARLRDDELIRGSLDDLADATGLGASPVDTHLQRWSSGLPQYPVTHVELRRALEEARRSVPTLAVVGAFTDGVGIPAVIAGARRAVAGITRAG